MSVDTNRIRVICITGRPGGIAPRQAEALAAAVREADIVTVGADEPLDPAMEADGLIATSQWPGLSTVSTDIGWIHLWGTGVDGVPKEFFEERIVSCSRGASATPIAEFVLASMLAFEKQLPEIWISEVPERWFFAELGSLHGRRLAVFGLGSIGTAVARLGLAFGMSVVGSRGTSAPSPLDGVELEGDLPSLVRGADHVVVAAPATAATHHAFDSVVFEAMGPGAHLVNIARGSLVDHDALRRALDDGHVARASLDTTEPEPVPAGHWLYSHPGVRLTPHVSWSGTEGDHMVLSLCAENIRARAEGRPLPGLVDPKKGY